MIEVKRYGEGPCADPWFLEELKLIDADFRPLFDLKAQRWLIVTYLPVERKVPKDIQKRGYIIEYCVSKGKDYTPLDRRTIYALQVIMYLKEKLRVIEEHLTELKESDDTLGKEGLKAWQQAKRAFLQKMYGFMFTETFT